MCRAVLEGIAFGLRSVMESLAGVLERPAADTPVEIRAVGGGTSNALWNTIKASVLGCPLSVLGFQEAGVLGVSHAGVLAALDRFAFSRNGNGRKRTG